MKQPHKIVIWFKAEGHKILEDGKCSGRPVATTGNIILDINVNNEEEVKQEINRLTEEVRRICQLQQ